MDWFQQHAVLFALLCAAAAVAYGLWLTVWLLGRPAGNERMQEIARAVQEGAAAYLRRQYTTIAMVSIVPLLLIGFYNKLGWSTAIVMYWRRRYAAAPSWTALAISCMRSVPAGCLSSHAVSPRP